MATSFKFLLTGISIKMFDEVAEGAHEKDDLKRFVSGCK